MQDPKEIKLFLEGAELKDPTTLAEAKVENGDTLAMTYALEGELLALAVGLSASTALMLYTKHGFFCR